MLHLSTSPILHTAFDLAAWTAGGAVGWRIYRWRLREAVASQGAKGSGYYYSLALGAVAGAWAAGSANSLRSLDPVLSHSVVGALVGAIIGVELYKIFRGVQGSTGGVFVGSFATGLIIGRLGCLFAGLADGTYGTPTIAPWAVDLGDGIGRHPVQVYESLSMALFLAIYILGLARRRDWAMKRGFYALCIWYGAQRFAWEFLKPYPELFGGLNLFQFLCLGLVGYGWIYDLRDRRRERLAQERAVSVSGPDHQPV